MHQVVIDTNVIVSALRSKRGASHHLISLLGDERWQANLSVALVLQYEAAGKRACADLGIPESVADDLIDMLCARGRENVVRFRWRRTLPDPNDDFVLELAIAGGCRFIVTYNRRDFSGAEEFGVQVVTPQEFLRTIGEASI
jgi:putative PIN family toxin of toxin-antitoxin system